MTFMINKLNLETVEKTKTYNVTFDFSLPQHIYRFCHENMLNTNVTNKTIWSFYVERFCFWCCWNFASTRKSFRWYKIFDRNIKTIFENRFSFSPSHFGWTLSLFIKIVQYWFHFSLQKPKTTTATTWNQKRKRKMKNDNQFLPSSTQNNPMKLMFDAVKHPTQHAFIIICITNVREKKESHVEYRPTVQWHTKRNFLYHKW